MPCKNVFEVICGQCLWIVCVNLDFNLKKKQKNFGIESHLFSKSQFDRINKFVEAHSYHFTPLDSLHDNITDTDDDSDLVAVADPDTLIRIVRTEL